MNLDFWARRPHLIISRIEYWWNAMNRPSGVRRIDDASKGPVTRGPWRLLHDWPIADDSSNGIKRAVAWRKPAA
ncbi:MAG: hypothetical protein AAGJ46_06925 [Planctomycetota bacterium]